jgi:hypothetical protein
VPGTVTVANNHLLPTRARGRCFGRCRRHHPTRWTPSASSRHP